MYKFIMVNIQIVLVKLYGYLFTDTVKSSSIKGKGKKIKKQDNV